MDLQRLHLSLAASRRGFLLLPLAAGAVFALRPIFEQKWDVRQVGVEAARTIVAAGALIIDVREAPAFALKHIAGAISVPLEALRVAIPQSVAHAKDQAVLVYCGNGSSRGPESTAILNRAGFINAVNLEPGFRGWSSAGLPVA